MRRVVLAALALLLATAAAAAGTPEPPVPLVKPIGPASPLFTSGRDGCDGNDVPDVPARAIRAADGLITMFALHYTNHPLRGPDLAHLKVVCRSALSSAGDPDPAAYADKSWIAALWTRDGRSVDGLVHHEYQADSHPGRCRYPSYMQCWFNTVLAVRSTDAGATFVKAPAPVVASAPFRQDQEQGRHRGFFNPSNIVSDGRWSYFLASTTGWDGQEGGVCLFRSANPDDPAGWRAYDGRGFTIRYRDPYRGPGPAPAPCETIQPFPAPVGSLSRQQGTGLWVAVFQAAANAGSFPVSGIYAAGSRDLVHWSLPRLVLAGRTNYEDPCGSGGRLLAYPSLIDERSTGRNFDTVGDKADLLYATLKVEGCTITADRVLMRQPVSLGWGKDRR